MTLGTLLRRTLVFHVKTHLGVVAGAAIGCAALTGALLVGDSVRESLKEMNLARLGPIHLACLTGDRLFPTGLNHRIGLKAPACSVLVSQGVVSSTDGAVRVNQVQVFGVDLMDWPRFANWGSGKTPGSLASDSWTRGESALINETLARRLNLNDGDEIILRVRKPSALALDAAISPRNDTVVALRLTIGGVAGASKLGDLSLAPSQTPAANLFLPLEFLSSQLGVTNQANLLVVGKPEQEKDEQAVKVIDSLLREHWQLEDAGIHLRVINPASNSPPGNALPAQVELGSARIFLDDSLVQAAWESEGKAASGGAGTNLVRVLTYLANLLRSGARSTPYSMVAAADPPCVPGDLGDDEMVINTWLADDLGATNGSHIEVSYFVVDSGAGLVERTNGFRVREIVPIQGWQADRSLMPEFPGIARAESTHDWDAGFPLVYTVRDKDEAYWKQFRGVPKAFVSLKAGQKMWANRFGALTSIHRVLSSPSAAQVNRDQWYQSLRSKLNPADFGLRFLPVRSQMLRAAAQAQDFGQLFLGFSIFLIAAALLLMSMLFQFSLEQRVTEAGTLLALGFPRKQVRKLFLFEGITLAVLGGILGASSGIAYAKLMLFALGGAWRGAVGTSALRFHGTGASVGMGFFAGTVCAIVTLWFATRKFARRSPHELLAGETVRSVSRKGRWSAVISILTLFLAVVLGAWALRQGAGADPGVFFPSGALLLIAGLCALASLLARLGRSSGSAGGPSLVSFVVRGTSRRSKRSVATVALLASGCFVIASIGVFRLDATRDASARDSGTGGFALIGTATLPLLQDVSTRAGLEFYGLDASQVNGVRIVPFRVTEGDEASCLNLNRAQKPRLLGVRLQELRGRFHFSEAVKGSLDRGWDLLRREPGDVIPAIGDANSIQWALGKKVGDTLDYLDERGRPFKLRIVGAVANSILQGSLIVDEGAFVEKFPSQAGYRQFLIDAPPLERDRISRDLSRAWQDSGVELGSTVDRLNAYNAVQNTYLTTFQALGGVGLLLGSVGLGIIVLRNVLERRGELAVLLAVGFRRSTVRILTLAEHALLLFAGLALGIVCAAAAVFPALRSSVTHLPLRSLTLLLAAVLLNGLVWTLLATLLALRGNLLTALRNE